MIGWAEEIMMAARVVLEGLAFPEGPRWRDGLLWFSDVEANQVLAIDAGGVTRTVIEDLPGGPPSGLGWLPDGRLLVVATAARALLAVAADGTVSTHADLSGLASYRCNDMVVDPAGRAYVGSCDLRGMPRPAESELILVQPDGTASVADPALRFPNGTVITSDGTTLIVAETFGRRLTAYTIGADGALSGRRVWADLPGAAPDGICLDQDGCVWYADPRNNACVRVAEGGKITDRIDADRGVFACTLGGEDLRTLFVLTSTFPSTGTALTRPGQILAHRVTTPGTASP
jgi:sugar lactone lactonase YvrE